MSSGRDSSRSVFIYFFHFVVDIKKVEEYRRNLLEPLKSEPITVVGEVAKNINQIVLYEDKQQSTNEKMKIPETPKDERKPKVINNPEHVKEYTIVVVTKEIHVPTPSSTSPSAPPPASVSLSASPPPPTVSPSLPTPPSASPSSPPLSSSSSTKPEPWQYSRYHSK
ncbi:hypothetical protein B9Z55_027556 [Caenorhabditis nigoni]|uniref:Uncharacterized protein n=1 Tax=Caenorhabditis nigoni TaxID=1611254 RepID=A0A2G5SFK3_9PELO|nr:hypothetical protein B9Z55_027556 [Caenorhabditis nigoni]